MINETTFLQQVKAVDLIVEMAESYLDVVLIPAPEPKHCSHSIRAACNRNPKWYRNAFSERGYIRRKSLIQAFNRIARGDDLKYDYDFLAIEIIDNQIGLDND